MKRIPQLQPLSMEHHQSLLLAKKCRTMAHEADRHKQQAFCRQLGEAFERKWNDHFLAEEQTIFTPANNKSQELALLCRQLRQQHDIMRKQAQQIAQGKSELLQDFGELLAEHTRTEERQLFPMVEAGFTEAELQEIENFNKA